MDYGNPLSRKSWQTAITTLLLLALSASSYADEIKPVTPQQIDSDISGVDKGDIQMPGLKKPAADISFKPKTDVRTLNEGDMRSQGLKPNVDLNTNTPNYRRGLASKLREQLTAPNFPSNGGPEFRFPGSCSAELIAHINHRPYDMGMLLMRETVAHARGASSLSIECIESGCTGDNDDIMGGHTVYSGTATEAETLWNRLSSACRDAHTSN